ncbi:uncharacterized protein LOC117315484 [Pecten maximus]|uniref:uncharacterized protein LOC117315484 n=1 Tax=Pecten maximus TaxID=6579 RepID=UPI0014581C28|nr:uncharacterized protein LOC117315484 [Pecten maximus]
MELKERSASLESIPKDLLHRLKQFRSTNHECRRSREDSEVETCLKDTDSIPPSPRSTLSDDVFFRFPKRNVDVESADEKPSHHVYSDSRIPSPGSDKNNFSIYGDNSDWMLAERTKPRSPPVSPNSAVHYLGSGFTPIADQNKVMHERTPVKSLHCHPSFSQNIDPAMKGSPMKSSPVPMMNSEYGLQTCMDRTPIKVHQERPSPRRSPMMQAMLDRPYRGNRSPSPYLRETVERGSGLHPEYQRAMFMEELSKRGARKQLSFDFSSRPYLCSEPEVYADVMYPPRRNRFRANSDSDVTEMGDHHDEDDSRLIKKFLSHLNQRKRKASDRFDSDYEDDAAILAKRRRKELEKQRNLNYLKQLEADVNILNNKLCKPEPEIRPDNCSCAVMEKQFLNMAENAYKNIRRQDMSAEGFAQFRKELGDTNDILKESLQVLQHMKEFCEHRQLLRA